MPKLIDDDLLPVLLEALDAAAAHATCGEPVDQDDAWADTLRGEKFAAVKERLTALPDHGEPAAKPEPEPEPELRPVPPWAEPEWGDNLTTAVPVADIWKTPDDAGWPQTERELTDEEFTLWIASIPADWWEDHQLDAKFIEWVPDPAALFDPDCKAGKCASCVGGPCEHPCHWGWTLCTDGRWRKPATT